MDDDEFDEADILAALLTPPPPPVWRLRPLDFLVWGAQATASVLSSVAESAQDFATLLVGQSNYLERQQQFEDEVRLDLEHINEGDE